ncbi:MAG TPA: hypothetical protein VKA27_09480 [Sunxiuqinia sp.]|nr:hypothetical protein [Sunxiuqinia sp.]
MNDNQQEEQLLKDLMKHSVVEMPFADFEDRLMDKIYSEKQHKQTVSKNIGVAWIFFFLGLFFGLLITNMTANLNDLFKGIPAKEIALFLQIGIAVVLLFQFDRLFGYTFREKIKR